jgi:hypothetical protein
MFKRVLVLVAISALAVGMFAGYAYSRTQFHDLTITANHGAKRLMVQTKTGALTFTNTSLSNLTADFITVPATGTYRAVVRFTAESACEATNWCTAVIFVDGVQANPKSGTDFAMDSAGGEAWQGLTMERTSDAIVGTGSARNVEVRVDVASLGGGSWRLDDWSVVTELYKV